MKYLMEIPHTAMTKNVHGVLYGGLMKFVFVVVLSLIAAAQIGCSRDSSKQVPDLLNSGIGRQRCDGLRYTYAASSPWARSPTEAAVM